MIEIVICDDDAEDMKYIAERVTEWFSARNEQVRIHLYDSAQELLLHMNDQIALYLLDIDMPYMTGIEAASILRKTYPNTSLVFISNDVGSVFEVFKVAPLRFVRKECFDKDLPEALDAFYTSYSVSDQSGSIILTLRQNHTRTVPVKELMYLTSVKHYVSVHCQTEEIIVREKLDHYEKQLSRYHFLRTGKSFLVNLRYVDRLTGSVFILKNGEQIPISRAYAASVRQAYMNYLRKILQ